MRNTDEGTGPHSALALRDLSATETFGRKLGSLLFPHSVIALDGQLGAGKTHLCRAIAEGLKVLNPAAVNSPTFVLIQEYAARLPIFHFDAYRLSGPQEFLELGVDEYFAAGGVCLIEWAERVRSALPDERLDIQIRVLSQTSRSLAFTAHGGRHAELLQALIVDRD